jgi:hypothetical protein
MDPLRVVRLSRGATARVSEIGTWPGKFDHMLRLYESVVPDAAPAADAAAKDAGERRGPDGRGTRVQTAATA